MMWYMLTILCEYVAYSCILSLYECLCVYMCYISYVTKLKGTPRKVTCNVFMGSVTNTVFQVRIPITSKQIVKQ